MVEKLVLQFLQSQRPEILKVPVVDMLCGWLLASERAIPSTVWGVGVHLTEIVIEEDRLVFNFALALPNGIVDVVMVRDTQWIVPRMMFRISTEQREFYIGSRASEDVPSRIFPNLLTVKPGNKGFLVGDIALTVETKTAFTLIADDDILAMMALFNLSTIVVKENYTLAHYPLVAAKPYQRKLFKAFQDWGIAVCAVESQEGSNGIFYQGAIS